jgi:branched-chain amino acid transport system permease protein
LLSRRLFLWSLSVVALVALPPVVIALGEPFYIDLVRRIMILAIAAVSLNLILGYGGLVSFGHAAYLGIGAYAVGILAFYGVTSGWLQWAAAIGGSAAVAAAIGAISIRTSGLYFIMITLAFTQMLYYLGISLEEFGGDDGMRLKAKSQFSGLIDLGNPVAFYYLALALMLLAVFFVYRLVNSRFGMVLRAAKSNEARTRAIGFSPYPYRLAAFVIAGAMCGLSGALYANHTNYIVPGLMSWQHSGDLMFMVILGGIASTAGPVLGAFAFIFTEEFLKVLLNAVAPLFGKRDWAEYWAVLMGPLLVLSVIFFRRGLAGIFYKPDA